jgi:hypothetical protein
VTGGIADQRTYGVAVEGGAGSAPPSGLGREHAEVLSHDVAIERGEVGAIAARDQIFDRLLKRLVAEVARECLANALGINIADDRRPDPASPQGRLSVSISEQDIASRRTLCWNVREHPHVRHGPHGANPRAVGAWRVALAARAPTRLEPFGERALARRKVNAVVNGHTGTRTYTPHVLAYVSHPTSPARIITSDHPLSIPAIQIWNPARTKARA